MAYGTISLTLGPLTRDHAASLWAMRRWCQSSARALDIDVVGRGTEHVPPSGAFVYCSNHLSLLDILVLGAVLPGDYKWAAKRSLMNIPFLGWHLRLAGHVPVERKGGARTAAEVIARFERVLGEGKPLLVFPEGTRSEDGLLRPFKNGAFYAAVRGGAPTVPVAVHGTQLLMKKGAPETGDGVVHVRVGAPLYARAEGPANAGSRPTSKDREAARVEDLRERTYDAVRELYASLGGRAAPAPRRDAQPAAQTAA